MNKLFYVVVEYFTDICIKDRSIKVFDNYPEARNMYLYLVKNMILDDYDVHVYMFQISDKRKVYYFFSKLFKR